MVDEEGNLDIDEDEILGEGAGGEEDGWDVSHLMTKLGKEPGRSIS